MKGINGGIRILKSTDTLDGSERGAYVLEFRLIEGMEISVGRLGAISLKPGWYYYVGSAMNGLRGRLLRHLKGTGKVHWHIDYLTGEVHPSRIFYVISGEQVEGKLVGIVKAMCDEMVEGFGCSDCRGDGSHLFYSGTRKNFSL